MISSAMYEALKRYVPEENIKKDVPIKQYTTFRVGGEADCVIEIAQEEQLRQILRYLNIVEYPYFVLGNGSNLLVSDKGYKGVVLHIGDAMSKIKREGSRLSVQAGALMSRTARVAMEHGLTGMEFASGIPGTMGGGVVMNAGAYGGEFSQIVESVKVLDRQGQSLTLDNATMEFGYRTSAIKNHAFVVTEVCLKLAQGEAEQIKERMNELTRMRKEKQPLEFPSAGSTFKRPEGHFAGKLIMDAGLKGFSVGGAQVSEKHCGFVINKGEATAEDIHRLIQAVSERVYDTCGVRLEPEVIELGEF